MLGGEIDSAETSGDFSCSSTEYSGYTAVEDAREAGVLQYAAEPADAAAVSNHGAEILALASNAERHGREGAMNRGKMINNALGITSVFNQHRQKPVGLEKRSEAQISTTKKHRKNDMNDSDSDSDDDDYRSYVPLVEVDTGE